jgi:hypothetical protein
MTLDSEAAARARFGLVDARIRDGTVNGELARKGA